jgi:hypothetical protein
VRAVRQALAQQALAAPQLAALVLHAAELEPALRRARLPLRHHAEQSPRLGELVLALRKVSELQQHPPVILRGQFLQA